LKLTHVSKEYIASIFTVEEQAKEETNVKASDKLLACLVLFFDPEDGEGMFLRNIV
jgi:hypothetical protein